MKRSFVVRRDFEPCRRQDLSCCALICDITSRTHGCPFRQPGFLCSRALRKATGDGLQGSASKNASMLQDVSDWTSETALLHTGRSTSSRGQSNNNNFGLLAQRTRLKRVSLSVPHHPQHLLSTGMRLPVLVCGRDASIPVYHTYISSIRSASFEPLSHVERQELAENKDARHV